MSIIRFKTKEQRLCMLLEKAAKKLERLGHGPIWSSYDSGIHMAGFIRERISDVKSGAITPENKLELWGIFAPTSDWDDTVGDVLLGNQIFRLIDVLFGDEINLEDTE